MNIVCTGARGFIGSEICHFFKLRNVSITYFPSVFDFFSSKTHDSLSKDLKNSVQNFVETSFFNLLDKDEEYIFIHCSGLSKNCSKIEWRSYFLFNVLFTEALITFLPENVKSFIYLSSVEVYGMSDEVEVSSSVNPLSLYAKSKLLGEKVLRVASELKPSIRFDVVRVPPVYGPGQHSRFECLSLMAAFGIVGVPPSFDEKRAFIGVRNLSDFIYCLGLESEQGLYVHLVSDSEVISVRRWAEIAVSVRRSVLSRLGIFPFLADCAWLLPERFTKHALAKLNRRFIIGEDRGSMTDQWHPPYTIEEEISYVFKGSHD